MQTLITLKSQTPIDKIKLLGPAAKTAIRQALSRTLTGMKTDISREVRERYNVSAAAVRDSITLGRPAKDDLTAVATIVGKKIALYEFDPRPKTETGGSVTKGRGEKRRAATQRRPKVGVSVRIHKKRTVYKHSFIARMRSGHRGMFIRVGRSRLPIKELTGPAIPQMIGNPAVLSRIRTQAVERYNKNLQQSLAYGLSKLGIALG